MLKKIYNKEQARIEKFLTGIVGIVFLFYVVSCGSSSSSSTTPSSSSSLSSIRALTLEGVDDYSITLSWKLLTTEEGTVDPTIGYTVYAETNNGTAFTKDSQTESTYPITAEGMADGRGQVEVSNLQVNNLYRIVVEARDDLGGSSKSHLLAYTASELAITNISGVRVTNTTDSREVTVTWNSNDQAQGYLVQATDRGNEFGGTVSTDDIIEVICLPGSLLCEGESDQFAEVEEGKLKHVFQVNKQGGRYKVVVVPFNFRDLGGLEVIDEEGKEKSFTEGVLERVKAEGSLLKNRLADALRDNAVEVHIQVSKAGAPVDLALESTGNTISASWGHGVGAESYYAIITTNEEVYTFTNIVDRYEADGRFTGGGYTIFTNLVADTSYTVTVQSLAVVSNNSITNVGGEVSATISTKDVSDTLGVPQGVSEENLTLTNEAAGILRIVWDTPETNSVIGYNVFYWTGDIPPAKPQYVAGKGETNLSFTVLPNSYNVRVDVLSTYPEQEVVAGDTSSITIYGKPSMPRDLGIAFSRGSFTNIDNKLYATGYPLSYTGADTLAEAGGPLADVSYDYRYRVEGGEWVGYSNAGDEVVVSLMVDDLADPAVIKSGYGKRYEVELVASNEGGFVSEAATFGFTYKSFPEPLMVDKLTVDAGDRKLTVTWPEVVDKNGATVANYTVVLNTNPYALPVRSTNTVEQKVVFEGLENNQAYLITVIPNGVVTGNILTALSLVTGYEIGTAVVRGSVEEMILGTYTGVPELYTPQGAPEVVINLIATIEGDGAKVSWEKASAGSPATGYVLEYLSDVTTLISNIYTSGDAADAELKELDWAGAVSINVVTNDSGSYSEVIDGLNISTATNVFRVRAVRLDEQGKEWPGEYRYYAMGTDVSRPPNTVENLAFADHKTNSFRVTWSEPNSWGKDKDGTDAQSVGYRVSWTNTAELGNTVDVDGADTLFYEITGLTAGTQYYVKVEAKNDNAGENIYSVESTGNTYTLKPPGQVANITYSEHTTNGFTVSWDAVTEFGYNPEGKADSVGYSLELSRVGGDWQSVTRSDYTTNKETLIGLDSGISYRVRVVASNDFVSAAASVGGDTWTLSLPGEVGSLEVSDPSYDGVNNQGGFTVSWTAPTDTGLTADGQAATITGYEVAYAVVSNDVVGKYTSATREGTATTHVFTNLTPHTQYDIRIQAQTAVGVGIGSHVPGWVPSLPGAVDPDSILLTDASSSTIQIEWKAPQAGRAGGASSDSTNTLYKVEVSDVGEGTYNTVVEDYLGTVITVTNLKELTEYHARITAENIWGEAEPSVSTNTGTTLAPPTPPSMVSNLKVDSFSYDRVVLSWEAPTNTGTTDGTTVATLIGYVVKYKKTAANSFIEIDETGGGVRLTEVLKGDSTNATVIGLDGSTSYTFLVVAVNSANAVGLDRDAPTVEQTTSVAPPRNLRKATCAKTTSVNLAWDASTGATSYKLYRNGTEISDVTGTSYTDTGLTSGESYTYKVQSCKDGTCSSDSEDLPVKTIAATDKNFKYIIDCGRIPEDLTDYDDRSQDIFSRYVTNTPIVARYLRPGGTGDGSSPTNKAGNLKTVLERIPDASADKVYVVLLTGGNYQAGSQMAMKNHVAIIGGLDEDLGFSATVTELDGNNSYRVFYNNNNSLNNTALLYGVTIINGNAGNGGGMHNWESSPSLVGVTFSRNTARNGGGMYNWNSSPILSDVTFSGNEAVNNGGGMDNDFSSPSLVGVTFSSNTADRYGGGMANYNNSRPILSDVTFSGNTANRYGGGMYNNSSSPTLEGVTFSGNTADHYGGGMYNWNSSSPSLEGVTFSGNTAKNDGGGMVNWDSSSPSLSNVTFSGNTANRYGGGMYNYNNSSPSLSHVTFSGNEAANNGGGMYNWNSSPILSDVTFSGNEAVNNGGGMDNDFSSPSLVGVTFSSNTAANKHGGGMANYNNSRPILSDVTFSGNTAKYFGGGMYNNSSSPTLEGVTFSGNTADRYGGGMYNVSSSPSLVGVTFSGNTATYYGGGMYNDNDGKDGALIINGIFWGNTADNGPEFYFLNDNTGQENLRIYNSIVKGGTGTLVSGTTYTSVNQGGFVSDGGSAPVVISFSNIITNDPGLGALANNGGSVLTHAIESTSPAVNKGLYVRKSGTTLYYSVNNTDWYTDPMLTTAVTLPAGAEDLTDTDATGHTRTDRPDLGAYEYR